MIKNFNIGTRLGVAFGAVLLVVVAITLLGISQLGALKENILLIVKDRYPKVMMGYQALDGIKDAAVYQRNLIIADKPEEVSAELARLQKREAEVSAILAEFQSKVTTEKGRQGFVVLNGLKAKYEAEQARFLDLVRKGDKDGAHTLLLGPVAEAQTAYAGQVGNMTKLGGQLMLKTSEEAVDNHGTSRALILALMAAALALAGGLAWWITRSITVPLRRAVGIAETIAAGNLASDITPDSQDETGQLLRALAAMNESLVRIVSEVRGSAEVISAGTQEIASGTLDLSSRTEQQASSLEETASSMEELTSAVRQGAANAQEASRIASSAAQVAAQGGDEVAQVVERMGAISESSRKIADIIGVIDSIAFQTNILALNAAVEAARAGEQGRGFAVVATEVRNLAHRSSSAAKEIKELIEDSVDKVAAGNQFASQAGQTMGGMLSEIQRVASLMADIDASTREQTTGIEQINQAVTQMDQVTQQNAALVEEAAAAADSMQSRAEALAASVRVFVLGDRAIAAAPAAVAGAPRRPAGPAVKRLR
jgi:methyl-accepting chemotaxis protein